MVKGQVKSEKQVQGDLGPPLRTRDQEEEMEETQSPTHRKGSLEVK